MTMIDQMIAKERAAGATREQLAQLEAATRNRTSRTMAHSRVVGEPLRGDAPSAEQRQRTVRRVLERNRIGTTRPDYTADGERSWFLDRALIALGAAEAATWAQDPLFRGGAPMVEPMLPPGLRAYGGVRGAQERVQRAAGVQRRDVGTSAYGALAGAPAYVADAFSVSARRRSVLPDAFGLLPLPEKGMNLQTVRVSTGATVAIQATENTDAGEGASAGTTVSDPVGTVAGYVDVSVQLFERSESPGGIDQVLAAELGSAIGEQLDLQWISGSGSSGQARGLRNVSGIGTVTYTDASPTVAEFLNKIGEGVQTFTSAYGQEPDAIIVHPRRAAWVGLAGPNQTPASQLAIGGLPLRVVSTAAIPTNLGAGTNEDVAILVRADELAAYADAPRIEVHREPGAAALTVRVVAMRYFATLASRTPSAILTIGGTGCVAPW